MERAGGVSTEWRCLRALAVDCHPSALLRASFGLLAMTATDVEFRGGLRLFRFEQHFAVDFDFYLALVFADGFEVYFYAKAGC